MGLAVFGTAGPAVAAEKPPETLAREGKWVLNVDRDSCQLIAQFGKGDDMVMAKFTRFEPDEHFDLALIGKRMGSSVANDEARLDFGLKGQPVSTNVMNGNIGKWPASFLSNARLDGWRREKPDDLPPRITPEQEAAVSGLTVTRRGKRPFRLDFGSLAKPFAQLRGCATTLVHNWGYDQQVQMRLLRPVSPITPPGSWVTNDDYPREAVRMGYNGFVQFRLDVDAEGKVVGCYILARTSPDEFADTVCRVFTKRAKFQPALDERGNAVRSYFVSKMRFEMSR